mgnify:CR=1 FL=1|jgi:hypothetical protein
MVNPEILWAQSREKVFITLNIEGIIEQNITIDIDSVKFVGKNKDQEFDIYIDLIKIIDIDESSWVVKPNCVSFTLQKNPEVFWNKLSNKRYNNLRVDWNKWDIVEDTDSDEEYGDMTYEQENMINNFQDFTKTLPSEFMDKDLKEIFPEDINGEITDEDEDEDEGSSDGEPSSEESNLASLNIEKLDIGKLDENLISKMEEGRITRKDRESLSSNECEITEDSCGCCETTDGPIPENKEVGDVAPEDILDENQ